MVTSGEWEGGRGKVGYVVDQDTPINLPTEAGPSMALATGCISLASGLPRAHLNVFSIHLESSSAGRP